MQTQLKNHIFSKYSVYSFRSQCSLLFRIREIFFPHFDISEIRRHLINDNILKLWSDLFLRSLKSEHLVIDVVLNSVKHTCAVFTYQVIEFWWNSIYEFFLGILWVEWNSDMICNWVGIWCQGYIVPDFHVILNRALLFTSCSVNPCWLKEAEALYILSLFQRRV